MLLSLQQVTTSCSNWKSEAPREGLGVPAPGGLSVTNASSHAPYLTSAIFHFFSLIGIIVVILHYIKYFLNKYHE